MKTGDVIAVAAVAAMRSPNRDSQLPEGQAGLRLATPRWTGITTAGSTGTSIQPLSIALTGDARKIRVPGYFNRPTPIWTRRASARRWPSTSSPPSSPRRSARTPRCR